MNNIMVCFDSTDHKQMVNIMDTYGDSTHSFSGEDSSGNATELSVYHDRIAVKTNQKNGWVRVDTYWRDGTIEETYDGRWK